MKTWSSYTCVCRQCRYTRIKIPSIAAELNIPEADVEALLVSLILDRKIEGHIDQVR